jgi:TonB-dependent receptor
MKPQTLLRLLMLSTAATIPVVFAPAAFAQNAQPQPPLPAGDAGVDAGVAMGAEDVATEAAAATNDAPGDPASTAPQDNGTDISLPGAGSADIVVTGRYTPNLLRATPEVVSVLSSADIARTGEGDIAGALGRVTGLSVVGSGYVFVRGLGDRYSLALLNGSPLPSPEPLKRVVPLDIFPTNIIASTLVQKSYSVNFPGEFGGGVVNLTTRAIPEEGFLSIGLGIGMDSESTGQLGYTYFGSATDWTGFDNGARDVPTELAAALASGKPVIEGADFTATQLQTMAMGLANASTSVLQSNDFIPPNFSGNVTGGTSWDIGDVRVGVIATAGISNKWRTRYTQQQTSLNADLSGDPQTDYQRVVTDNRIVVNTLIGMGFEWGEQRVRWTSLYIRDTLKQARLARGTDQNQAGRDILRQDTAWYERQLVDTQLVGEFEFGPVQMDVRGSFANSQREAPYERSFTYVRTNLALAQDPAGDRFVNDLGGNKGDASIAFSTLNENLWAGGIDLSYEVAPHISISGGYAYSDTARTSVRRAFQFRAANLPVAVQQLRPDYLLSDTSIQAFDITLLETSAQDGTAAFDAGLTTHAGYTQIQAPLTPGVTINAGVRYESAQQFVVPVDLFGTGAASIAATNLSNDYWLPAVTLTWEAAPDMQIRLNASKTLARPQFRELVAQVYLDPESNRLYRGNPSLIDSQLLNAEARYEWYFARDQRLTAAAFFKRIDNPIEAYSAQDGNANNTSFANAPSANLYGFEIEVQKYLPTDGWAGDFWANRRFVGIANYSYTQSSLNVAAGDRTVINGTTLNATDFFVDGAPLTGQSDHLVNLQLGLEDTDSGSQQTFLITYASPRVTSRGPSGQPDIREIPGFQLDFVARESIALFGRDIDLKLEARNLTRRRYREVQNAGANQIIFNSYALGTSVSVSATLKF